MIKYISLFIFLALTNIVCVYGQSKLTFTATYTGVYHKFDSLSVEDLNTGSRIIKQYPDTVLKLLITGNEDLPEASSVSLTQNYPNPFTDQTSFDVNLDKTEMITLKISDITGRGIIDFNRELMPGRHSFIFKGGKDNMYIVSLRTSSSLSSMKMINAGHNNNSTPRLEYTGSISIERQVPRSTSNFEYNTGDILVITGYMTDLAGSIVSDTITDAPDRSKIYTLNFERKHRILILMYHKITDSIPADDYQRNSVDFENDLIYFRDHKYQVMPMNDLIALSKGEMKLESDAIILTFDDGYESNYSKAYPLLTSYNMPATFFLTTEWMGTPDYITWSEVWLMSQFRNADGKYPFVMGSHSSSHPYLEQSASSFATHEAYMNFLNTEFRDSKTWITDVTGQTAMFFSLPFGDGVNNADIIATAKSNGYLGIRTSVWSSIDPDKIDLFVLPAVPVLAGTPINMIESYFNY
jgi:peptidoglycan/xylan/chitin deacetylase (PgdA/CDA1 family)